MPLQIITAPSDDSLLAYINALAAYDSSANVDVLLDVSRQILLEGGRVWQGYSFPVGDTTLDLTLAPGATATGTLSIPPGSIIYAINADSTSDSGIRVRIYDKAAKSDISSGRFLVDRTFAGSNRVGINNAATDPIGPGFLRDPLFVLGPMGSLQVDVVNADPANSAIVQVLFCCAVPVTNKTANTPVLSE